MYTENDILFPHKAIPHLRDLRGAEWAKLVDEILGLPETHEKTLALMLMMVRFNGCISCETDSYRAMKGCVTCSVQMLRRFKGEDQELLQKYEKALRDIRAFADDEPQHHIQTD